MIKDNFLYIDNLYIPINKISYISKETIIENEKEIFDWENEVKYYIEVSKIDYNSSLVKGLKLLTAKEQYECFTENIKQNVIKLVGECPEKKEKTVYKIHTDFGDVFTTDKNPLDNNNDDK